MKYNTQNAKIKSITEKTLIIGIDVGSETHFARAFDWRNYEYSKKPLEFSNNEAGFETFKAWMEDIAEKNGKDVVIPGMEPTGHYWFNLGAYLQDNGMKPVHVNPHHVKSQKSWMTTTQTKMTVRIQRQLRLWSMKGDFHIHIYQLGFMLKSEIFRISDYKPRKKSRGSRIELKNLLNDYEIYRKREEELMGMIEEKLTEIPCIDKLLEIKGIGLKTVSGFVAEVGDITRFDDPKQLQKLAGYAIVECSPGKHKGESHISYRGRKRLRYVLYEAAISLIARNEEFKKVHPYYRTRKENPLKKIWKGIHKAI